MPSMGDDTPGSRTELTDRAWRDLVAELADHLDDLVEDFLRRLREQQLYSEQAVPGEDLEAAARNTLSMLIHQLSGEPLSPAHIDVAYRLGARRARQGVDRDSLLEAVRLDYRVLWAGLTRLAGDARAPLLVAHADEVLTTVERYIGDIQVAFLDEHDALVRSSRADEQRALAALLAAAPSDVPRLAAELADRFRFSPGARLEVLCVPEAAEVENARAASHRRHTVEWDYAAGSVLIREQTTRGWRDTKPPIVGGLVTDVPALRGLPDAVRLSQRLAPLARSRGALTRESDVWEQLAASALAGSVPSLSPESYPGLNGLPPDDRARLLETMRVYAATGSVKDTAERLFVHRNTVMNRLAAFADATGLDLTVPDQAARALIAFATA